MLTRTSSRAATPRPYPASARTRTRRALTFTLTLAALAAAAGPAPQLKPDALAVVERSLTQDQGGWLVVYRLRYQGTDSLVVPPAAILAKVEGWVSNSRVSAHATPRWSSVTIAGAQGLSGVSEVVASADEALRCRERVVLQAWTDDPSGDADTPLPRAGVPADQPPTLSLAPGASVRLRLKIEHLHALYGDYDPLLGARAVEVKIGPATLRDVLPLDREQYLAQAKGTWPEPPEDRRDNRRFVSAPDSLLLEAHIPGNHYYRFGERPVRYATKMRLRYWYFIAPGTEGECLAHLAQYKNIPGHYRCLSEGTVEEGLLTVGRWVRVEKVFRTEPEATDLSLDFRLTGDVGAMWVDDLSLEPLAPHSPTGP